MKVLGWIIGIIVLAVVGAGVFIALNSGNPVKQAIEEFGPEFLGTDVSVSEVNLALAEGSAQVKGLNIGNPPGFAGGHLMKLDEIKVVLDTQQISDTLVVMKQVRVDGADIAAVAKGTSTNVQKLMDNLNAAAGDGDGAPAESSGPEMKFIVERFDFTNANASLSSDILGDLAMDIPDIHLKDIGRKGDGATAAELAQQILKPIAAAISKAAVSQGLDVEGVKQNVEQRAREKLGEGLRSLTDRFKKGD